MICYIHIVFDALLYFIMRSVMIRNISKYILSSFVGLSICLFSSGLYAQEIDVSLQEPAIPVQQQKYSVGDDIALDVRVVGQTNLISGDDRIVLWGIEEVDDGIKIFSLKVRSALERKIAAKEVVCTIKGFRDDNIEAQCINEREEDLSLYLLQQGYASADRAAIYGSIYEAPYLTAEKIAQENEHGVWAEGADSISRGDTQSRNFLIGASFLIIVAVLGLAILSFYIMRGFGRVVDVQNQALDLATKERSLKDKEKHIVASMINSEIQENKTKIEAYLMVYEETLKDFDEDGRIPKYKSGGEVIQKQPGLSRVIFDGNTHKLELLGTRLPSELIHYYARIKTNPDYIELKTDMSEDEAKKIIETVVEAAQKLDNVSTRILESFKQQALIQALDV